MQLYNCLEFFAKRALLFGFRRRGYELGSTFQTLLIRYRSSSQHFPRTWPIERC